MSNNILISHSYTPPDIEEIVKNKTQKIKQQGDKTYVTVEKQLELLQKLTEFGFGRFLLQHQGLNGYWIDYALTYPWFNHKTKNDLETFILTSAPVVLATQQRFEIFLRENQKEIKNNAKLACIPCGKMGELLYLDFSDIKNIELYGMDYEINALEDAKKLATEKKLSNYIKLIKADAWHLDFKNEFDLVSSNGLNIYEPNDEKVTQLYQEFYKILKPNGKLVTSFLTYPPNLTDECEWDMSKINAEHLLLQKIIFKDIIEVKFQCYRSSAQTQKQLETVGFKDIKFIYDKAKIFPTVVAYK